MSNTKHLALLIDSDNVSAKYAPFILQEAAKYGELSCKRVYGDWEKGGNGWHFPAINNAILPVQQTSYIAGKNATDFSIIIDAMDLLYSGKVDGFVLVTSDSDFTRLAIRLREAGMLVVGIGEVKTPLAFTSACHHFSFLNQVCDTIESYTEKDLREAVVDFIKNGDSKGTPLTKLDSFITSRFGNVDYNRLGYTRLSVFVDSISELRRRATFVCMKKSAPPTAQAKPTVTANVDNITKAITDYLSSHSAEQNNVAALNQHLTSLFGKLDYSKLGTAEKGKTASKRFAKFLDGLSCVTRDGANVTLAQPKSTKNTAEKPKSAPSAADVKADVTAKKAALPSAPAAIPLPSPTTSQTKPLTANSENVSKAIEDYLNSHGTEPNNMAALEKHLIALFGKLDYSKLGTAEKGKTTSKRFSKLLDRLPFVARDGANVTLVQIDGTASDNPEKADKVDSNVSPKLVEKTERIEQIEQIEQSANDKLKKAVIEILSENEGGMTSARLNGALQKKLGKGYLKELGIADFAAAVKALPEITEKNHKLTLSADLPSEIAEPVKNKKSSKSVNSGNSGNSAKKKTAERAAVKSDNSENTDNKKPVSDKNKQQKQNKSDNSDKKAKSGKAKKSDSTAKTENNAQPELNANPEKADQHSVKRFILQNISTDKNGATLTALGKMLAGKFGGDYLERLGVKTLKQFVGSMHGVELKNNRPTLTEEFVERTSAIEDFVYNFARNADTRSLKALSTQIKKEFSQFDYTDYGYAKFSDFVNAIDGVRANGYYVEPVE